jgi:hypothetical protein
MNLIIANAIAVIHGFILIPLLVFAPLIIWFSRTRYKWLEISFSSAAILSAVTIGYFNYCLLSSWEYFFRSRVDPTAVYTKGFVVLWMEKAGIYWTDEMTFWVGGAFIVFGFFAITKNLVLEKKLMTINVVNE